MTIKELCENCEQCNNCPFFKACPFYEASEPLYLSDKNNEAVTIAIIETAKILQEDENV